MRTHWIELRNGGRSAVDSSDAKTVFGIAWFKITVKLSNGVVSHYVMGRISRKLVFLHRLLLNTAQNEIVDHKDGDGLNNRRSNIRLATRAGNARNRRKTAGLTSKFKGVCWSKVQRMWHATITVDYKRIHIGYFEYEEDAAVAYDFRAAASFKEFAHLNFPKLKLRFIAPFQALCPHGFEIQRRTKFTAKCPDCCKARVRYYNNQARDRKLAEAK